MADLRGLFDDYGEVEELGLDEALTRHLRERGHYPEHRVSLAEILQVHEGRPRFFLNTSPSGRAPVIMVGQTTQGRWLCIPIEPTVERGTWRVITAFQANTHHIERYRRGHHNE
jgi:hypothetical protein